MIQYYVALLENSEDESAFVEMYKIHLPILTRTGFKYFSEKSFVEDALQMTWMSVARNFVKISSLPGHETTPYLVTIMKNKCKDILRQENKYVELYPDEDTVFGDEIDKISQVQQEYQNIVTLIRKLPAIYREILERRLILEQRNKEVAKSMNISEALAAKRFERGRSMLIENLLAEEVPHE